MDTAKALERYLRHHRTAGSSPATLEWHRDSIGRFIHHLSTATQPNVEDLSADDLRQYIEALQARDLSPHTVQRHVRSVKAWGRWLAAEEYARRDPFGRVKMPKADDAPKPALTLEEVERLLKTCDTKTQVGRRDRAIMLLLFSTGLRASEALALEVGDLDHGRGLITVKRGKGGRSRVVPLGRVVEKAIERYLKHPRRKPLPGVANIFLSDGGAPMLLNNLQLMLHRKGKDLGIRANPHLWRHTAARHYLRNGGRVEALRVMLGHSTLDMTLHYARLEGADLTAAHETADPASKLKGR